MESPGLRVTGFVRLLTGILMVTTTAFAAGDLSPVEAYSSVSEVRNIAISPSGKRVAYQRIEGGENSILVVDVSSGEFVISVSVESAHIGGIQFVGDDDLMLVYDVEEPYGDFGVSSARRIRFLDIKSGDLDKLRTIGNSNSEKARNTYGSVVGRGSVSDILYIPMWEGQSARFFSLFEYSLKHGTNRKVLARGSTDTLEWYIDENGRPLVREDFDPDKGRHTVHVYRNGEANVLTQEQATSRDINIVALTPRRDSLIFSTRLPGSDEMSYHTMSLKDGSRSEPVFSSYDGRVLLDSGKTAFGFERTRFPNFEYEFLNQEAEDHFRSIEKRMPGANIQFITCTDDFDHMVIRVSESWGVGYYLLFSKAAPKPVIIAKEAAKVFKDQLIPRDTYELVANDGRPIRTLLTARDDIKSKGAAPLVVMSNSPQWLAQYFASRGFIVVQPGGRGLQYGTTFMPASDLNWGGKLASDINDTVKHFVDRGIADPARICVVGFGIGGYAALSAAANSPETFRCVASINGLYDLRRPFRRVRQDEKRNSAQVHYFETYFGVDARDNGSMDEMSPVRQVSFDFAPTLIMYFKDDDNIFEDQAKDLYRALQRKDADVDLEKIQGIDLRFDESETRLQVLTSVSKFVQEHL